MPGLNEPCWSIRVSWVREVSKRAKLTVIRPALISERFR